MPPLATTGVWAMNAISTAVMLTGYTAGISPGEGRTLLELLGAVLGVTKWPVLGLAVIAGAIAWGSHEEGAAKQSVSYWAAFCVASAAAGWFLASLLFGE